MDNLETEQKNNNNSDQRTREVGYRRNETTRQERSDLYTKNKRRSMHSSVYAFGSSTPRMLDPWNSDKTYWISRRSTSTANIMSMSLTLPSNKTANGVSTPSRRLSEYESCRSQANFQKNGPSSEPRPMSAYSVARRRTDLMPVVPSLRETAISPTGGSSRPSSVPSKGISMSRLDQLAQPRYYRNKSPIKEGESFSRLSIHPSKSMTHLASKRKSIKCSAEFTLQLVPTTTLVRDDHPRKIIASEKHSFSTPKPLRSPMMDSSRTPHPQNLALKSSFSTPKNSMILKSPVTSEDTKKSNRLSTRNKQDNSSSVISKKTSGNFVVKKKELASISPKKDTPPEPIKVKSIRKSDIKPKNMDLEPVSIVSDNSSVVSEIEPKSFDSELTNNSGESKVDELSAVLGSLNDLAECDMAAMKSVFRDMKIASVDYKKNDVEFEKPGIKIDETPRLKKKLENEIFEKEIIKVIAQQPKENVKESEPVENGIKDIVKEPELESKAVKDVEIEGEETKVEKTKEELEIQKEKEDFDKQKAKEEAEKQQREIELKLQKAMEERQARRKRVEAIMSRTRNRNSTIMTTSTDELVISDEQENNNDNVTDDPESMTNSQIDMISV